MEYYDAMAAINQMTQQNNEWSAQMAANQMNFQERLSNTAHQREVADLKAAGLNPVLSAHTQGASTPQGATAPASDANISAIGSMFQDWMNTESAMAIAAAGAGRAGGSFGTGKNAYIGKTTWEKAIELLLEGAFGQPMEDTLKDAGAWIRKHVDQGDLLETVWNGLTGGNRNAAKPGDTDTGVSPGNVGLYDYDHKTGQFVFNRNGRLANIH